MNKGRVLNEKKGIILDIKKNIKTNTNPYSLSIYNILKSILVLSHTISGKAYTGVTLVEQKIFNVFAAQELEASKICFGFQKALA